MMSGADTFDPSVFFSTKYLLVFLIGLALMLPVGFATYLAPQLIVLHDQPAGVSHEDEPLGRHDQEHSFRPRVRPLRHAAGHRFDDSLGLGLLISIPIMVITNYTVYRDIFIEEMTDLRARSSATSRPARAPLRAAPY